MKPLFNPSAITNAVDPDLSAESIMDSVKGWWRENKPQQSPEVYVVSTAIFEELKKLTEQKHAEHPLDFCSVYGARVEAFDTEEECTMRAIELYSQGVRVALCLEAK